MHCRDRYGLRLTTSDVAADSYNRGVGDLLRLRAGAVAAIASSVVHDPTFALGHAALALLGHDLCAPVDVQGRMRDAERHAARATERERSHVHAILSHLRGDSTPVVRHLATYPVDALLLSAAVPTIAFAGVTEVPQQAWNIVERAAPAYGDDWWYAGLLAFVRQEQGRFDEAMELSCRSLEVEPGAGHSAHARAHAHYETGDHLAGLTWMDAWVTGDGASIDSLSHFSWHAALHELSLGNLDAVRARYDAQLRPEHGLGCRALVDSGSLLIRWAMTPDAEDVPDLDRVAQVVGRDVLERPSTPFLAMHSAVTLLALGDGAGLERLARFAARHPHATQREVVAPLTDALRAMHAGRHARAAAALGTLSPAIARLGGSDAQREIVEEVRIAALIRAGRLDEARELLDRRLDRRTSPRDERWREDCLQPAAGRSG
ncbi:pyridine nucleotide-disulfide oxidoreductase [Nocardioides sp. cx-173]|uniref:pyridine nucleotide-disulfide oxidoreductase n=1 Tax=Nocardioides sp. cx-173 TaxID=2898796 RepID=UPI001E607CC8|nr:pyridine nucleotide-disulfide oxidoreductase [Nocardioides sp. cx-173]MCD4525888.1 pyridine nucleotide-disulfide oxidoreductase [Nocardioides sp. cx-173]UGB40039.1 pyridine nucleotide-disulfide oxidoreductase [Nocardioides sp. cx-173]